MSPIYFLVVPSQEVPEASPCRRPCLALAVAGATAFSTARAWLVVVCCLDPHYPLKVPHTHATRPPSAAGGTSHWAYPALLRFRLLHWFSLLLWKQWKPNGNLSSEPQNGTPSWDLLSSLKPSMEGLRPTICQTGYRPCRRGGKGLMGRGDNRDRVHRFPLTGSDANRGPTDLYKREAGSPPTAAPSPHPPTSHSHTRFITESRNLSRAERQLLLVRF